MPSRSSPEVQEIINTVREPFRVLEGPTRRRQAVEAGTFNFEAVIPSELGTPVISRRRNMTHVAELMESILSWPLRYRVSLAKSGTEAEKQASRFEATFAHAYYRSDPSGYHRWRVRSQMVRWPYGAMWLSVNPHNPPSQSENPTEEEKAELEDYEQGYWRWNLSTLNPDTVSFLRRDGKITLAVVDEKIPVEDLCKYLDNKDDQTPLDLISTQLPGLRGEDGKSEKDGEAYLQSSVRRIIVDDGSTISCYVEQDGNGRDDHGKFTAKGAKKYVEVGKPFPNTFGEPSLILFPAVERPNAPSKDEQYEALMAAMCEVEYDLTVFESIALTVAANPRWAVNLPEDVAKAAITAASINPETMTDTDLEMWGKSEDGSVVVPQLRGPLQDAMTKIGEEFRMAYEGKLQQWAELNAKLSALGISPEEVTQGTAAAVLAKQEAGVRAFERPHSVISAGFQQFARMIAHDVVYGLNKHLLTSGSKEGVDKGLSFKIIGQEAMTSKALKPGDQFDVSPSEFMQFINGQATVTVEIIAATDAQKAAKTTLALQAKKEGYGTLSDIVEAKGVVDVQEELKRIAAEKNAELLGPGMATWAIRDAIRRISIREERDEMMLLGTWMPQPEQPAPQVAPTASTQSYKPPATAVPGAS